MLWVNPFHVEAFGVASGWLQGGLKPRRPPVATAPKQQRQTPTASHLEPLSRATSRRSPRFVTW